MAGKNGIFGKSLKYDVATKIGFIEMFYVIHLSVYKYLSFNEKI